MAPPPPKRSKQRRPKIDAPPFDVAGLHAALIELLRIAATWEAGAEKPRADSEERMRARGEDEAFLQMIYRAVHSHTWGALLVLSDKMQLIPLDQYFVPLRKAAAAEVWRFKRGEIGEEEMIASLRAIFGEARASADEIKDLIGVSQMTDDGIVRDVGAGIKEIGGPDLVAAKLIRHLMDRAGRFTFEVEKAAREQPFGAGALLVRSRGRVVTTTGVPRYLLKCMGYPADKIEAAISVLHGPKGPPPARSERGRPTRARTRR